MILLVFGLLTIASLFIVAGWFREGWRQRVPATVYNAALVMAVGMDLTAIGFAMQLSGRIWQIMVEGASFATDSPFYWIGTVAILAGKTCFVWIAALGEGRSYSRKFWWSYWLSMGAWCGFTILWYL